MNKKMDRIELLEFVTNALDNGEVSTTSHILNLLKSNGIVANMHVGKQKEDKHFFDNPIHRAEWLLGGYYDIIEQEGWFAMNRIINYSLLFLKKQKTKKVDDYEINH